MAITGVPRTIIRLVAYIPHTNNGILNQVIPGALILWIVTMKFRPVNIDEKPAIKAAIPAKSTFVLELSLIHI